MIVPRLFHSQLAAIAALALTIGCSNSMAPDGAQNAELLLFRTQPYRSPLEVGLRTSHQVVSRVDFVSTSSAHTSNFHVDSTTIDQEDLCLETTPQGTYIVRGNAFGWVRLRQDDTGLYRDGTSSNVPPTCKSLAGPMRRSGSRTSVPASLASSLRRVLWVGDGSAAAEQRLGETRLLAYPFRPGQTWVVNSDFGLTRTVEVAEMIDTRFGRVPAWRVVDRSPSERGTRTYWYGRQGLLKSTWVFTETLSFGQSTQSEVWTLEEFTRSAAIAAR